MSKFAKLAVGALALLSLAAVGGIIHEMMRDDRLIAGPQVTPGGTLPPGVTHQLDFTAQLIYTET